MVGLFRRPGESEEDAEARFSREAAEAAPDWLDKDAEVIEIKAGSGPLVSLVRGTNENGLPVWRESDPMRPRNPKSNAADLSPDRLLELLRGPLGS